MPAAVAALSRAEKRPRSARGVFAWRRSPGRAAKGTISEVKVVPAARGRSCVATFGRARLAKGAERGGRDTARRTGARLRSDAGAFCVTTFSGQNGKGRCLRRSMRSREKKSASAALGAFLRSDIRRVGRAKGAERGGRYTLADRKTSPQRCGGVLRDNIRRTERQSALSAAVGRSRGRKKRPHGSRTALSDRKNTPQRAGTPFLPVRPSWAGRTQPAAPGLTSGGALVPLRPPPFPRPPQRAGPGASPPAARACTGRQRRRWPAGGRRTSGGCRNGFA